MPKTDVLIVGSGLAALVIASRLCMKKNVIIFTKGTKYNSNSMLAQGGVAAAFSSEDHWQLHYQDTMIAGCQHNDKQAVKNLVEKGPTYIFDLIQQGMKFDLDSAGKILLGQEGAHSKRRILHAGGDATGKALTNFLFQQIKDHVTIIEHQMAIDLVVHKDQCIGVKAIDEENQLVSYFADSIILATGGCGGLYEFTSNASTIVGDGYAMAYRAGVDLVDMEFVQFHPTLLYSDGICPGLISEAVRGEGAILRSESGRRIMKNQHPLLDLAPRDIVSRVIFEEIQKGELIHLDISMIEDFTDRFPTITTLCEKNGAPIKEGKIPVVPGAHFMMGGIKVNEFSQSSLRGLFAVGEVACTGVHGANRLASNSLLEGIVFSNQLAEFILDQNVKVPIDWSEAVHSTKHLTTVKELPTKEQIKKIVLKSVGIIRNKEDLEALVHYLEPFTKLTPKEVNFSKETITQVNMMTTAWLIASSALLREESRGCHYRSDFPGVEKEWDHHQIIRNNTENACVC
ncbi:L-aspartate oxidase [Bacillus sp. DJP31]|uniref:L-aspartate oxidase n=1 Tax=Bacillus sp. DJP31 TaxID=3409789 RepID=UPI003BB6EE61